MNQNVIDLLNAARASELTAIMQYMAHHYELENADFHKLADELKRIAIEEMKHAERFAERILFLGGTPTYQADGHVMKGQSITDMMTRDYQLEEMAIRMYNESAIECAAERDQVSKDLFEELLVQEEGHLHHFENINSHVEQMGDAYLATLTT